MLSDIHESEMYVHNLLLMEKAYASKVLLEIPVEWFEPGFSQDCIKSLAERIKYKQSFDYLAIIVQKGREYEISKLEMDNFKDMVLEMTGYVESLQEYKSAIRTSWLLREIPLVVYNKLTNMETEGPLEVMDDILKAFDGFRKGEFVNTPTITELYSELLAHQKEIAEMGQSVDMFYELPSLNKIISNPPGTGRFGVIAASTSHGKSSLISPIVLNCIEHNIPCYVQSGEMHELNALQKLIQYQTGLPSSFFDQGALWKYPDVEAKVKDLMDKLDESDLCMFERSGTDLSLTHVRKIVRVLKETKGVDLFIFDRAELFKEFIKAQQGGDKVGAMTSLAAELRTISTILGVTIILFAQSTNEATKLAKGRTTIGTIYGGRSLTASADFILGIYNPTQEGLDKFHEHYGGPFGGVMSRTQIYVNDVQFNAQKVEIIVLKDTYGGKGAALIVFIPEIQRFVDIGEFRAFSNKISPEDVYRGFLKGSLIPTSKDLIAAFNTGVLTVVPGSFDDSPDFKI